MRLLQGCNKCILRSTGMCFLIERIKKAPPQKFKLQSSVKDAILSFWNSVPSKIPADVLSKNYYHNNNSNTVT